MKKSLLAALLLTAASASAAPVFTLSSPDFNDNALMAKKFAGAAKGNASCTGENISPALSWNNPPEGTKSFALVVTDPVGAKGLGVDHLVAYNIPFQRTSFAQGELTSGKGYTGGKNSPGTLRYHGPCPPVGSGEHHYNFTLIATDLPANGLEQGLTREALFGRLKGHTLGAAGLIGRFGNG
ncbi:YbhB/YbcL family Raf kinase inhibitor-like protein [Erwinia sp. DT-104]|jgi:Raf kinase inhibitor-like YbhB/YbcL family protein|uniref:YbhB/YbcL family Raf kinase inhibitor-like protein n=2 Tax=Erwinia TaxID=551 RepID=A0ABV4EA40_9GAMM|nr:MULTISPECIES: YbhB/YbcL family Raf kinase inhibitor-like protein [unclassified Erwinia]MDN4627228.1 YbhB/YbcL family Raf kinase inhibitor-like protein [Erwinia sp. PsM31]MDN8540576.1 YbhB/YbcL family Raf kinase inhibitor-like protein [Erwinia sp. BC051422]